MFTESQSLLAKILVFWLNRPPQHHSQLQQAAVLAGKKSIKHRRPINYPAPDQVSEQLVNAAEHLAF